MAMLNQTVPIQALGCPLGACRQQARAWGRTSWRAFAAGFGAGALLLAGTPMLAGTSASQSAARPSVEQQAAAARWAALVREQTPRELPREWRQEIKGVNVDGMFRKRR